MFVFLIGAIPLVRLYWWSIAACYMEAVKPCLWPISLRSR
jgi:hypothetical protein